MQIIGALGVSGLAEAEYVEQASKGAAIVVSD
jgi:uncharacterized protein GlcG (DUF336 family)